MAIHDFSAQRLFIEAPLAVGSVITCNKDQAHYLLHVLRAGEGDALLVFNGQDGEWRAEIQQTGKRACTLHIREQTRRQMAGPDIHLLFAPLKRARLDYMMQKATELGVAKLVPVLTQHTVPDRVNTARMRANAIEAAEQCGVLHAPDVAEPVRFDVVLKDWDRTRTLIFCDESTETSNPIDALSQIKQGAPVAVIIGPEGGFSEHERQQLRSQSFVHPISLGPRVMRADTAATAALALVNAVIGDWV